MKFLITRKCGHKEKVKVYLAFPRDDRKQKAHEERVTRYESHWKVCRRCRGESNERDGKEIL